MINLKRFLSIILSASLFLSPVLSQKSFAYTPGFDVDKYLEEHCYEKNDKGGYINRGCASIESQSILLKGEKDYVIMRNLGPLADQTVYHFNFKALDKILEEIGIDTQEMELQKQLDEQFKQRYSFTPIKVLTDISLSSLVGTLCGHGVVKFSKSNKIRQKIHTSNSFIKAILDASKKTIYLTSAVLGGLLSAIYQAVRYDNISKNIDQIITEKKKIVELNDNKSHAFRVMLRHIEDLCYSNEDFFVIRSYPDYSWSFSSGKLGLNYTEEEKVKFPQKFEQLAKDIRENLARRYEE